MGALIRIVQMLPLLLVLGVLAGIAYIIIAGAKSPARAKEILIKVFMVLSIALCAFFALASLYAALEHNANVLEFFAALLVISIIMLCITLICKWRFRKNHPHYTQPAQRSRTMFRWESTLRRILRALKSGPRDPRC